MKKSHFKENWHLYTIIAALSVCIVSLIIDLRLSRENERSLSRKIYQYVKERP